MDHQNVAPSAQLDPLSASREMRLVVCFATSTSKNFAIALAIAQQASWYRAGDLGGMPMHAAGFGSSPQDASIASALLRYVTSWKGTLVFANGRLIPWDYKIQMVLDCYMDASACDDPRAHCERVIDDPDFRRPRTMSMQFSINESPTPKRKEPVKQYAFPCAQLWPDFRFQPHHPASHIDQIQAAGVKSMCNLCPNFEPDAFREVGVELIEVDAD